MINELGRMASPAPVTVGSPSISMQPQSISLPALSRAPESEPPIGIVNGVFSVADSSHSGFGWDIVGDGSVTDGRYQLVENGTYHSGISQSFVVPAGAQSLRFTIVAADLQIDPGAPPDAFEVALLDHSTGLPLVSTLDGLATSDALLNLQSSSKLFTGPNTGVPGITASGDSLSLDQPVTVQVDLTGVAAGTVATLYFDLLGFGQLGSSVVIDNVALVGVDLPLVKFISIRRAIRHCGRQSDQQSSVTLVGSTDPVKPYCSISMATDSMMVGGGR